MKTDLKIYFVWSLVVANMFYFELLGLNALIVTVVTITVAAFRFFRAIKSPDILNKDAIKRHWFAAAFIWLVASLGVFINATPLNNFIYVLTFLYFISQQNHRQHSILFGVMQTIQSFVLGMIRIVTDNKNYFTDKSNGRMKKILKTILLLFTGLVICIIFLKLYQSADERFYELTKFINLDWISWGFIAFYVLLSFILYGLFFFQSDNDFASFEDKIPIEIKPNYTDRVQNFFGQTQEKNLTLFTLIILNTFLILFLFLEATYLIENYGTKRPVTEYSQAVHGGIDALIASLILVILVVSFFFRGQLNYHPKPFLKVLVFIWLSLNVILVFTTALKNYDYMSGFGFTYKRLGIILYLILCLVGLTLTFYKIQKKQTAWFLVKTNSLVIVAAFAVVSLFNWNAIIANHNIKNLNSERLDLHYIYSLGADTYPYLLSYYLEKDHLNDPLFVEVRESAMGYKFILENKKLNYSWRSFNLREQNLLNQLNKLELNSTENSAYLSQTRAD